MNITINSVSAKNHFDFLTSSEQDFKILVSSVGYEIIHNNQKKFHTDKKPSFKLFDCVKKLKKELDTKLDFFSKVNINKKYYDINIDYLYNDFSNEKAKEVFAIDITSCYLTILFRKKFISKELFDKINNLQKKDRLKCLGLLAHKKNYFVFKNGVYEHFEKGKPNIYENVFFYCVSETFNLMQNLKVITENNFICCWVDCIYFKKYENINEIFYLLKSKGFKFTCKRLFNSEITKKENYVNFSFENFNKIKKEKKYLNIPLNSMELNILKMNLNNAIFSNDFKRVDIYQKKINDYHEKNNNF